MERHADGNRDTGTDHRRGKATDGIMGCAVSLSDGDDYLVKESNSELLPDGAGIVPTSRVQNNPCAIAPNASIP